MGAADALVDGTPATPAGREPARHASGRRPRRRAVWIGIVAAVLLLAGWGTWLAHDAMVARRELLAAADLLAGLQDDVLAGDTDVSATLTQVQAHAAAALESTHGIQWSAAGALPWVGDNVHAVQAVSEVVDTLAADVLPDLADVVAAVDPAALAPVDGRVDLAPLRAAAPTVVTAARKVDDAQRRLDQIDTNGLWSVVASPLADLRTKLDQLAMTTGTASRAVQLLPAMLGADGPRTYLVLVQNPAEPRATGGVPALVTVQADDGVIGVGEVVSSTIGRPTPDAEPVVELSREEQDLFSNLLGGYMGDVTFTPDFPRSAEIARTLWLAAGYPDVDGVLSIEPGAIGRVLGVTGPVTLSNGVQLTDQNAAAWLMNTVYVENPANADQDRLFAEAVAAAFAGVTAGQWEPQAMMVALAGSAREGRLMVWSAHEQEQALLSGTVLAGELRGNAGDSPVIGVFVNDGSQSKIGYYLDAQVTAATTQCRPDGARDVTVTVALALDAPADIATYPAYIAGGQVTEPGTMRLNVLVYAPTGGRVEDVVIEGAEPGVTSQVHDGLSVVGKTVTLAVGSSVALEYRIVTGPDLAGPVLVRATPLAGLSLTADAGATC